jgi:hypothetical protein
MMKAFDEIQESRRLRWRLGVFWLLLTIWLVGSGCTQTYRFPRLLSGPITDQEAVEFSGRALAAAGMQLALYEAAAWNGSNYFARNYYSTNNGYVLWRQKGSGSPELAVELQLRGTNVICEIGRACH